MEEVPIQGWFKGLTSGKYLKLHSILLFTLKDDIKVAFTHLDQYGEDYFSFVNGNTLLRVELTRASFS